MNNNINNTEEATHARLDTLEESQVEAMSRYIQNRQNNNESVNKSKSIPPKNEQSRNESVYQMDIQIDTSKQRPQSGSHRPILDSGAALIRNNNKNIIREVDEIDSISAEEMAYMVFDTEEGKYIDIRDLEKDIYVTDSVTYFDKRQALQFTTISQKSKIRTMWADFWSKKDKNNRKLIKAVAKGDIRQVQKLLNQLRSGEKVADISFCDPSNGLSALHTAVKYN